MERSTSETDFLIVGAGPAGLIAGLLLLRQNFNVKIIERHHEQMRAVCGEYLSPEGRDHLITLGLENTLEGFEAIRGMILHSPAGQVVKTTFPMDKVGVALNREIFQKRLAELFLSAGGTIEYDKAVTKEMLREARWVIGADGRKSQIAKLMNFKEGTPTEKRVALHCYLKPLTPLSRHGQMHILPDGSYVGINPISDSEVNFSLVTDQAVIKDAGGTKELLNFWIQNSDHLRAKFPLVTEEEIKSSFPIKRIALEVTKDNVVLIGDASGFIDPLTGEGITTAIKTARMLAGEIAISSSVEEAFRSYAVRRMNDFSEKEQLNYFFQKVIRYPGACEAIALVLNGSKKVRDTFIGVIGNIYSPSEALKTIFKDYLTARF